MKKCLDKSGIDIDNVKKILIHQANEKMDEAIIQRFYKLYDKKTPEGIMPMSISFLETAVLLPYLRFMIY